MHIKLSNIKYDTGGQRVTGLSRKIEFDVDPLDLEMNADFTIEDWRDFALNRATNYYSDWLIDDCVITLTL